MDQSKGKTKEAAPHQIIKRSVLLAGHRTSVTLEQAFWDELEALARREGLSLNKLIMRIDSSRQGNLASALRLYVLKEK
jgi:predicted DNA-binding ribbon-helix-helix protein